MLWPSPSSPEGYQAIGFQSPTPEGYLAIGSSSPTPEGYLAIGFRLRPRRGRTLNNPRSSRGREGERSEASRHRATWGYRWSASKDLGEVSRGRRHAGGGGVGCGRLGGVDAGGCFDMSCCPRETSPRSFHSPCSVPRSLTVVVACFAAPPRPFDDLGSFMV